MWKVRVHPDEIDFFIQTIQEDRSRKNNSALCRRYVVFPNQP